MDPWHVWVIVGVAMFVLEIFTPGFVLAAFGIGCFVSAIAALVGLPFGIQILAFSIGTLGAFFGIRPFVLKRLHPGDHGFKSNVDALVGQEARVLEAVDPSTDSGRVLVAGEDWRAVSATGEPITKGSSVTIVEIDGAKVVVVSEDSIKGG
jgi:membrane protein implicated in regulation of membrane protease activity